LFQLGVGEECTERVRALIENDVYVYPGQWANDKDGKVDLFSFYTIIYWLIFLLSLSG
jgi:hypothetical protein